MRTHCSKGHQFTPENTRLRVNKRGTTVQCCEICRRANARKSWKNKVAQEGYVRAPQGALLACPECGEEFYRGSPHQATCSDLCRFMSRVLIDDSGCWLWQLALCPQGYGRFMIDRKQWGAHRASWILLVQDEIPGGYHIDHVFRASDFGAPHRRERLYLVAHPSIGDEQGQGAGAGEASSWHELGGGRLLPNRRVRWIPEPSVDRVAHGLPNWMVSPALHALGNAVVPAISEHIGRLIVADAAWRLEAAA